MTLNNADEKTRLVPVLNTILKLNRNETEMLNCVAKGQRGNSIIFPLEQLISLIYLKFIIYTVSETTQRVGGWGNFLPWGNSTNNN